MLDGGGIAMGNMPPVLSVTLLSIPDTAVNGDVVGYATATDPDGDNVTFSFENGDSGNDPSGTFHIDANGVITVANADNIGSQDGTDDSVNGWSFAATVVASDGQPMHDTALPETFMVWKSPYQIISPTNGGTLTTAQEVKFEGTRTKLVQVEVEIKRQALDGSWTGGGASSGVIVGGDTHVDFNFGTRPAGDYKLVYSKKLQSGWKDIETIYFKVV